MDWFYIIGCLLYEWVSHNPILTPILIGVTILEHKLHDLEV